MAIVAPVPRKGGEHRGGGPQGVFPAQGGGEFGAVALMLGDNVYPSGVSSPDDPQLIEKMEKPYADLNFPFYVVLGNHDYGPSWEFWKARAELDFTREHRKFRMPDRHYAFSQGPATFLAVDTNTLFWGVVTEERTAFQTEREKSRTPWKIAFGHHPYVSNGKHGNAASRRQKVRNFRVFRVFRGLKTTVRRPTGDKALRAD